MNPTKRIYILFLILVAILMPLYYGSPNYGERVSPPDSPDSVTLGEIGAVPKGIFLGEYKVTFYTNAPDENGGYVDENGNGITKTGNPVTAGITAAVLHGSIPYGTSVLIEGIGIRIVDDCGVGADHIDVAAKDKETADKLGVQYRAVYMLKVNPQ